MKKHDCVIPAGVWKYDKRVSFFQESVTASRIFFGLLIGIYPKNQKIEFFLFSYALNKILIQIKKTPITARSSYNVFTSQ